MFEMTPMGSGPMLGIECVDAPQNKPFCIVHGYDRDWDLKGFFEFKYSQPGTDFSLERFKLDRASKVNNIIWGADLDIGSGADQQHLLEFDARALIGRESFDAHDRTFLNAVLFTARGNHGIHR
jgi:hypothetical protein